MSIQNGSLRFSGYIRRLVDEGFVSAQQMKDVLESAKKNKMSTVEYLIEKVNLKPLLIAEMISSEFGEPIFDLDSFNPDMFPKEVADSSLFAKHSLVPLVQRGKILYVATSDPTNIEALDAIRFNCGLSIEP
ncbi:MAG: type IV-A pilus assembly ATPase PilB, partial [Acinetobacter sp.]